MFSNPTFHRKLNEPKIYLIRSCFLLKVTENDIVCILCIPISVKLGEQTVNSLTHVNND